MKVESNQSKIQYDPGTLDYDVTYYWKIVAWDNHGSSQEGSIWSFTTEDEPNNPPDVPSNPSPTDGASGISISSAISWSGGDPDPDDKVLYDVYFGVTSPPALVSSGQDPTSYDPGTMSYSTTYYWKIVSSDGQTSTEGEEWEFTTKSKSGIGEVGGGGIGGKGGTI